MPRQTMIWTALPNGLKSATSPARLKLSAFLSPRLFFGGSQTEGKLESFTDFLDWPAVVKPDNLKVSVVFEGSGQSVTKQAEIDTRVTLNSALWKKLFDKTTFVRAPRASFAGADQPYSSYPASDVTQRITDGYTKLGISSPFLPADNDALKSAFPELHRAIAGKGSEDRPRPPRYDETEAISEAALADIHAEMSSALLRMDPDMSLEEKLAAAIAIAGRRARRRAGTEAVPLIPGTDDPASAFAKFSAFHRRPQGPIGSATTAPPEKKDFHQFIAAFAEYPNLLRRLGLVIDLEVSAGPSEISQFGALRRLRVVPKFTTTASPIDSYSPATKYLFDLGSGSGPLPFAKFCAAPRQAEEASEDAVLAVRLEILGGLLNLSLSHPGHPDPQVLQHDLVQIDVDGAGLKVLNAFGNMAMEDRYPGKPIDGTGLAGAPAMRTSGISLTRAGHAESLFNDFAQSATHAAAMGKDEVTEFHAEDLVRGYRLDIRRFPPAIHAVTDEASAPEWKSVHRRTGTYRIGGEGPGQITLSNIEDEGFLQPVLVQDPTASVNGVDPVYIPESLCHWQGWSLSVAPPANPMAAPETSRAAPPDWQGIPNVGVTFEAQGLPYLRFGHYYQLRLRTVDLAGNGLSAGEADAVVQALEQHHREVPVLPAKPNEFQFRRFDPIIAPTVVLCSELTEGETPDLLVIRSNRGVSAAQYAAGLGDPKYKGINERHILPPKGAQLAAEVHGRLDGAFGTSGDPLRFYNICLKEGGTLNDTSVINITTGAAEPLPDVPIPASPTGVTVIPHGIRTVTAPGGEATYAIHYEDKLRLPYLPDPLARGAALFGLPGVRGQTGVLTPSGVLDFNGPQVLPAAASDALGYLTKINFGPANAWPEMLPFKLQLDEEKAFGQQRQPAWDNAKRILKVRLRPGETTTVYLSSYPETEDVGLFGLHYWWSAHAGSTAEQRAFLNTASHGALSMLSPAHRLTLVHAVQQPLRLEAAATTGALGIRRFKGDTAFHFGGKFRIHAASTSKFDLVATWKEPAGQEPWPSWTTHVFEVPVYADGQPPPAAGAVPIAIYDQDTLQFQAPAANANAAERAKYPARQDFGDTKHRRVTYKLTATTRYKEFFPKRITDQDANITAVLNLDEIVPSSAAPSVPEVKDIHPVFGWKDLRIGGKLVRRDRFGGGLRIYLGKDWYSSGEGEQLAVVAASGIRSGIDPVHPPAGANVVVPSVPAVRVEGRGDIYPFDIKHDEKRGWFSDISFKVEGSYFPFVRLTLARYQKNSLKGLELSENVDAGIHQLAPKRAVALTYEDIPNGRRIFITVEGAEPAKSATAIGHLTEVILQERNANEFSADPELGWSPAAAAQQPVADTRPSPSTQLWVGKVVLADSPMRRRLVIREFELFDPNVHPAGQSWLGQSEAERRHNRRLVYADTIPV